MKLSATAIRMVAGAVLAAAVVGGVAWVRQLRSEAAAQASLGATAEALVWELRARLGTASRELRDASGALQACSNRLASVEAEARREEATHAPLRRQIEAMQEQQIADRAQIDHRQNRLREAQDALARQRQEADALRIELTNAVQRATQLVADLQARTASETALRAQVDEARKGQDETRAKLDESLKNAAALQTQLDQAQARQKEAADRLAEQERTIADLRQALGKAQTVAPAPAPVAAPPSP